MRTSVTSNHNLRSALGVPSGPLRTTNPRVGYPTVCCRELEHDASKSTGQAHGPDRTRLGARKPLSSVFNRLDIGYFRG